MQKIALALLVTFFEISFVQAHPHNWIELNSRFVLDEHSHLIQVKQRWEFDLFYSLMTHADLLNEFDDEQQGLTATAERMIKNLSAFDYFSNLYLDGSNIALGLPKEYSLKKKQLNMWCCMNYVIYKKKIILKNFGI